MRTLNANAEQSDGDVNQRGNVTFFPFIVSFRVFLIFRFSVSNMYFLAGIIPCRFTVTNHLGLIFDRLKILLLTLFIL
jgi:hypothetical protein